MAENSWATEQEAIRLAVARAAKLPDRATIGGKRMHRRVTWEGEDNADRWAQGGALIELRLGAITPIGKLEPRQDYDAGTDTITTAYGRYERFTVTCAIDIDNQDPAAAAPGTVTGRLRTRLQRPDVLAILQAANVAYVGMGPTSVADYEDDGRVISAARVDIFFAHTAWDSDEEQDFYVAHLEAEGEFDSPPDADPDMVVVVDAS